jgi:hypothetical protein
MRLRIPWRLLVLILVALLLGMVLGVYGRGAYRLSGAGKRTTAFGAGISFRRDERAASASDTQGVLPSEAMSDTRRALRSSPARRACLPRPAASWRRRRGSAGVWAGGLAGETESGDRLAGTDALPRRGARCRLEVLVEGEAAAAQIERDVVAGGVAEGVRGVVESAGFPERRRGRRHRRVGHASTSAP